MLLRSSSTPLLGSLLTSINESPNNNPNNHHHHHHHDHYPPTGSHHRYHKANQSGSLHISCNSSPNSGSIEPNKGFRRAQSEGNLGGLVYGSSCNQNDDHINTIPMNPKNKVSSSPNKYSKLESIPSFSFRNSNGVRKEEEEDDSDLENENDVFGSLVGEVEERDGVGLNRTMNEITVLKDDEIRSLDNMWKNSGHRNESDLFNEGLFLARGLGLDGGYGGGGGGGGGKLKSTGSGGDSRSMEEYYKKMVEENPGNPMFLRNYAHFLYESKRDLKGAEEYYSRAILVDPNDGDVLSHYAKIIWELHHDKSRAQMYFDRAIQASPQDSHVHAAYASFLWEAEDDEEEDECNVASDDYHYLPSRFHGGALAFG